MPMKLLCIWLITLLTAVNVAAIDPTDKIGGLIGKGNVHELAGYFAPNVELIILDATNTYPKAQAEVVIEKFFAQNKPINSKMLHKVSSGTAFRFGVVVVNTDHGAYRVAFTLKMDADNTQLIELRVEREKVN
jgi:hypothetical protein